MDEVNELYQELIVDHYKNPRCQGTIDCPDAESCLYNPLCGDQVCVQVKVDTEDGIITKLRFTGKGCSISQASTSMMTELCEGKSTMEARDLVRNFSAMLKDRIDESDLVQLGDAASLQGVKRFAARIKCAMLGWEALEQCLSKETTCHSKEAASS